MSQRLVPEFFIKTTTIEHHIHIYSPVSRSKTVCLGLILKNIKLLHMEFLMRVYNNRLSYDLLK